MRTRKNVTGVSNARENMQLMASGGMQQLVSGARKHATCVERGKTCN